MEEMKDKLEELKQRFEKISEQFDRDEIRREIRELEAQMNKEGFWNDANQAKFVSRQLSSKQKLLGSLEELEKRINDALELCIDVSIHEDIKKRNRGNRKKS